MLHACFVRPCHLEHWQGSEQRAHYKTNLGIEAGSNEIDPSFQITSFVLRPLGGKIKEPPRPNAVIWQAAALVPPAIVDSLAARYLFQKGGSNPTSSIQGGMPFVVW